jgi:hypothetical protein
MGKEYHSLIAYSILIWQIEYFLQKTQLDKCQFLQLFSNILSFAIQKNSFLKNDFIKMILSKFGHFFLELFYTKSTI